MVCLDRVCKCVHNSFADSSDGLHVACTDKMVEFRTYIFHKLVQLNVFNDVLNDIIVCQSGAAC